MKLMVLEVLRIPQVIPHDRMVDQLKIHFLKRRNSGGDVLTVIYPTSTPGQAYVIFESVKVPGVLECTHILDINNNLYPIHVKKADLSEVDMPIETILDLHMFPKHESVRELLESYDFIVTEGIPGRLQLKGSFLKLKLIRNELQLQWHRHLHCRPSSDIYNGSYLGYELERNLPEARFVLKSMQTNMDEMDAVGQHQLLESATSSFSSYQVSTSGESQSSHQSCHLSYGERNVRSPVDVVGQEYQRQDRNEHFGYQSSTLHDSASSISAHDPSALNLLQHTSSSYRDSVSGGFPRNFHSTYHSSSRSASHATDKMQHHASHEDSDALRRFPSSGASSSHSSPSSSCGGISSFPMDTDLITFIQTQQQNEVNKIMKGYGTEMVVQSDADIATVTFLGKNSEDAKACFLNLAKMISPSLRTQEIHLKKFDHDNQMQILERSQRYHDSGVLIDLRDDVIKLVGPSIRSFEIMQKILIQDDDLHQERAMERGSKGRRSSSLPRHYKMTHLSSIPDPEPQSNATTQYTPSRYQEKPDEGKAPKIVQPPERPRRNAEYHNVKATRDQRVQQNLDLTKVRQDSLKNLIKKRFDRKNYDFNLLPHKLNPQKQSKD